MRTGVRVYPSSRDVAGGPRARAGGRRLVHRGAAPVQLRAQLRRTPCQIAKELSAQLRLRNRNFFRLRRAFLAIFLSQNSQIIA